MTTTYESLGECGTSGDGTQWRLALDAIATTEPMAGHYRQLYLLSAVGPQTSIKGVTALLQQSGSCSIWYEIPGCQRRLAGACEGFRVYRHRLAFDHWQMLAVSESKNFLANLSQRALWNKFSSAEFTTPMLRAWVPEIARRLVRDKRLQKLESHRCAAGLLYADDALLDKYVSDGVRDGVLQFETEETA